MQTSNDKISHGKYCTLSISSVNFYNIIDCLNKTNICFYLIFCQKYHVGSWKLLFFSHIDLLNFHVPSYSHV